MGDRRDDHSPAGWAGEMHDVWWDRGDDDSPPWGAAEGPHGVIGLDGGSPLFPQQQRYRARPQPTQPPPPPSLPPGPVAEVLGSCDLVRAVLGCLGVRGICTCAAVCRLWRQVADSPAFWEEVSFDRTRPVTRDQLMTVLARHTGIRRLRVLGVLRSEGNDGVRQLGRALGRLTRLTHVHLSDCTLSHDAGPQLLAAAALRTLHLERVKLRRPPLSEQGDAPLAHAALSTLILDGCDLPRIELRMPCLTTLAATNSSFAGLTASAAPPPPPPPPPPHHGAPLSAAAWPAQPVPAAAAPAGPAPAAAARRGALTGLRRLDLEAVALPDADLRVFLGSATALTGLRLAGGAAGAVSDDTLRAAAAQLPALAELSLSMAGAGATFRAVPGFPGLTRLELRQCDAVDSRLSEALEGSPCLEELVVQKCPGLTLLEARMPRLKVATISGCRALRRISLRARALRDLRLDPPQPGAPAVPSLTSLALASDALRRLEVRGIPKLASLALEAPLLVDLAVAECDSLCGADVALAISGREAGGGVGGGGGGGGGNGGGAEGPVVAATLGGGAPALERLRVESCGEVRELELTHRNLRALSVVSCERLSSLAVSASRLTELCLEDCGELSRIALRDAALDHLALGSCSGLTALALEAPRLSSLDLRGCGRLERLSLACAGLESLDATFCGAFSDAALADLAGGAAAPPPPPLRRLVLSVCPITSAGLSALAAITTLRHLDLSYTDVTSPVPLFAAAPGLTSLTLSSCKRLDPSGLLALAPAGSTGQRPGAPPERRPAAAAGGAAAATAPAARAQGEEEGDGVVWRVGRQAALPCLRELDLSYVPMPPAVVDALLLRCTRLTALRLNGVEGATGGAWRRLQDADGSGSGGDGDGDGGEEGAAVARGSSLEQQLGFAAPSAAGCQQGLPFGRQGLSQHVGPPSPPPSALEALSLVRCPRLRSFCLGVAPLEPLRTPSDSGGGAPDAAAATPAAAGPAAALLPAPATDAAAGLPGPTAWRRAPSPLHALRSVRLGLSAVEVVSLELPLLEHLDLNGCTQLRTLRLACPRLAVLSLQACGAVGRAQLAEGALAGCPMLRVLDIKHTGWGSLPALHAAAAAEQQAAERGGGPGASGGGDAGRAFAALAALADRCSARPPPPPQGKRRLAWDDRGGAGCGSRGGGGGGGGDDGGGGAIPTPAAARALGAGWWAATLAAGEAAGMGSGAVVGAGPFAALDAVLACDASCPVCSSRSITMLC